jgi:hypothetical protein
MLFRIRHRRCKSCQKLFRTNEIAGQDLDNVMTLWERDVEALKKAEGTLEKEQSFRERLMRHYDLLLRRRGKGAMNSVLQPVDMLGFDSDILKVIQRLKANDITILGDLLLYPKSELVGNGILTEEEWSRICALFSDSGIELEDDMESLTPASQTEPLLKITA